MHNPVSSIIIVSTRRAQTPTTTTHQITQHARDKIPSTAKRRRNKRRTTTRKGFERTDAEKSTDITTNW
jgi:hypothetical protein